MWYVENVGYVDRYDQMVRREYYVSVSMALKGRHDTYYIRLRDSKTGETQRWFLSEAELVVLMQSMQPYGLFTISNKQTEYVIISLGKYGYKFLDFVDNVELVNSREDGYACELIHSEGFISIDAVDAVDEQLSLFRIETGEYSSLFDLVMDEEAIWKGDFLYLFNMCVGSVTYAYRVKFVDAKRVRSYISKVKMLSGNETSYIVSVDEA